jgi:uncharacterized protein (DUF3820 family)
MLDLKRVLLPFSKYQHKLKPFINVLKTYIEWPNNNDAKFFKGQLY